MNKDCQNYGTRSNDRIKKPDTYWASRIYTQAIAAPEVNAQNEDEVMAYVRKLAQKVCLDPDKMAQLAEDQFIPVSTDDFKKANELVEEQTLTVSR